MVSLQVNRWVKPYSNSIIFFMKLKADFDCCVIAKHHVEKEPRAEPHREGARKTSLDIEQSANQEVRN